MEWCSRLFAYKSKEKGFMLMNDPLLKFTHGPHFLDPMYPPPPPKPVMNIAVHARDRISQFE